MKIMTVAVGVLELLLLSVVVHATLVLLVLLMVVGVVLVCLWHALCAWHALLTRMDGEMPQWICSPTSGCQLGLARGRSRS